MTKFSTWNQVFDICKIKELKQFLTLKLALNWSPFKYFACHVWTVVILGVKGFHWGYLRPSLPPSKGIFSSGSKIHLQSKHIWFRMWQKFPAFEEALNFLSLFWIYHLPFFLCLNTRPAKHPDERKNPN